MNNFSEPFVSEERFEKPEQITQMFAGVSEWLYEEVPIDNIADIADTAEQELYTRSRLWYNDLPKEDKQKVDCLIRNSMPRA